ncbi:LuxR family transcriptional regulator, partial [Maribacter sp.]|nr:LuxR family transcriptional regulator [Maribacter sp.]
VQNEREIIKLKNEQLRVDFSSKSKEVAASLMSIAKKNDLLRTIKDELRGSRDDDSIKTVINTINKSLRQNDDWVFFQEAFNNADSEFLKNIKAQHPVLTPSDLKLCGYLRLNLSTKEMSELLNITSRSVEIKRYRLRKKLNLQHEDNLVNYILAL